jgi:hypothetical protein
MTDVTKDLWPEKFADLPVVTPVAILKAQGQILGQKTANVVLGRVYTQRAEANNFRHVFHLYCPPLGYETELLQAVHGIKLYPVRVTATTSGIDATAINAEEFSQVLSRVFASGNTRDTIESLLAQSTQVPITQISELELDPS